MTVNLAGKPGCGIGDVGDCFDGEGRRLAATVLDVKDKR
jgi:hypothetical protein